eukprot:GHVR01140530.1.p1 GENE.GHVR01140530.1~~GHVR01140530.1.p1  ORF type:complete len:320 (-),score=160.72 GHVR01140530.1:347-1306(-)
MPRINAIDRAESRMIKEIKIKSLKSYENVIKTPIYKHIVSKHIAPKNIIPISPDDDDINKNLSNKDVKYSLQKCPKTTVEECPKTTVAQCPRTTVGSVCQSLFSDDDEDKPIMFLNKKHKQVPEICFMQPDNQQNINNNNININNNNNNNINNNNINNNVNSSLFAQKQMEVCVPIEERGTHTECTSSALNGRMEVHKVIEHLQLHTHLIKNHTAKRKSWEIDVEENNIFSESDRLTHTHTKTHTHTQTNTKTHTHTHRPTQRHTHTHTDQLTHTQDDNTPSIAFKHTVHTLRHKHYTHTHKHTYKIQYSSVVSFIFID